MLCLIMYLMPQQLEVLICRGEDEGKASPSTLFHIISLLVPAAGMYTVGRGMPMPMSCTITCAVAQLTATLLAAPGVEAAGEGVDTQKHAATITKGSPGVLHGSFSLLLQDAEGQVIDPHSISAG